jgi:hypothetical protein
MSPVRYELGFLYPILHSFTAKYFTNKTTQSERDRRRNWLLKYQKGTSYRQNHRQNDERAA